MISFPPIDYWVVIGFTGQLIFFGRFIAQWIHAEKKQESSIPVIFWYLSILGGIILVVYAIHQRDIVFTVGQAIAVLIYLRNLQLMRRAGVSLAP
ncbi:hypothetical protein A3D66_02070 [Candidatus Kaiserbacteria bacterium RIFCSPHIGHO2_02_FULL_50_9]|uniref:Lipid A biosynthesis N-terminal domain-containing protein n=1 Tax=Candidatus Kaiserbacteria bacterium RIFCSPLOWO2_01_FULL_51_21 TaxID=1798508 RepID=A0A1F6EE87_9BACT|nr:MAG: hypothetical protein A2761_02850 [Candidatus Kaiserbacteria bacterium RIFCSPHIGHO2_01_FULL_51_33]OGG63392.1 MAG: hypothetical protein A3D66_02070 [Candidatus Kaiserbacteria bacterium RIFCSPHIGHO2_02_FULL_50_9]OGG71927.1 MAG: hypothetical protein A3A35_02425 [Candidatus Kaiserbacteria bacterium RIFCSPLOWO2_01_FULL_51_21]